MQSTTESDVAVHTSDERDGVLAAEDSGHDRRRARSRRAVLNAAREVLADDGFEGLTIEGVTARSGVAKSTIYRSYRSKTDLALAVLLDMIDEVNTRPFAGDTRTELVRIVERTTQLLRTTLLGRVMQGLVSQIAIDPQLADTYREHVVSLRREEMAELVERGIERGELRPGLDSEMVLDLILGPIYYRFFLSGAPFDADWPQRLVDHVLPALARPGA